jgi:hypothetical protein
MIEGVHIETVRRALRLIFLDAPAASDLPSGVKPERETTAGSKPAVVRRNAA